MLGAGRWLLRYPGLGPVQPGPQRCSKLLGPSDGLAKLRLPQLRSGTPCPIARSDSRREPERRRDDAASRLV